MADEAQALDLREEGPPSLPESPPQDRNKANLLWNTCRIIAQPGNEMVPKAFWGRPEAAMAAILLGRELGLGDMISLQRIHVIQGRPTLAAELIRGLIRRGGHSLAYEKRDETECVITGTRKDTGDTLTVKWDWKDAERAKLTSKDSWKNYPRAMLDARATTELARALFSDCIGWAVYAPEDMGEVIEDD